MSLTSPLFRVFAFFVLHSSSLHFFISSFLHSSFFILQLLLASVALSIFHFSFFTFSPPHFPQFTYFRAHKTVPLSTVQLHVFQYCIAHPRPRPTAHSPQPTAHSPQPCRRDSHNTDDTNGTATLITRNSLSSSCKLQRNGWLLPPSSHSQLFSVGWSSGGCVVVTLSRVPTAHTNVVSC